MHQVVSLKNVVTIFGLALQTKNGGDFLQRQPDFHFRLKIGARSKIGQILVTG